MKKRFLVQVPRLFGLMIAGLLVFVIIALDLLDDNQTFESPMLLTGLNGIFLTTVSLSTAVIAILGYIRVGLWRFLALSAGSVVFGVTALLAGSLMGAYGANIPITIYNIGSLLAALCYSVTMFRFGSLYFSGTLRKRRFLTASVTLVLSFVIIGIIVLFSIRQVFPPFFIQGIGSTPIRQVILGLAIVFMGSSAINIYRDYMETRTSFNFWFALGLFCIALGFVGVYNMTTAGNALNWAARISQYIGNLYLLAAATVSLHKFYSNSTANEDLIAALFQEPALNYRLIMETDPNAIAVVNDQGRILRWNKEAERLFGYTSEEVTGSSLEKFILPDQSDTIEQSLISLQEPSGDNKEHITTDLMARCKDGQICPVRFSISGTVTSLGWMGVATIHDISKRKQAEEDLKQYAAKLETANNELESFAYSVSHDLRTPLRTLDGFSEMVLMEYGDKLDETGKQYLNRIRKASQTMAQLTEDLLKLSRITRTEMRMERVDLSALTHSIAEELMQGHPDRDVEFIIDPGMTVHGDKALLQILMRNLLENSWKYTSTRASTRIEAGIARRTDGNVYFVQDNGIGFDMHFYDKLFEPFQRLHNDKQYSGTGIGLATAQRIISRHGGRIWAESVLDKGAQFFFTLGSAEDSTDAG